MDYLVSADELFDREVQRQIRAFCANKGEHYAWYRVQNAVEKARRFRMYHDSIECYTMPDLFAEDADAIRLYYKNDVNLKQISAIKRSLKRAKAHKYKRGKVSKKGLKEILKGIEKRRADRYLNPEKYMNKKILCIVGESGVGKTLASLHLQNYKGANVICSFTTRPPRSTEVEGREHHFIDIVPDKTELLAYAKFGDYHYYALKDQVFGPCTVYVIDEEGLRNLILDNGNNYDIYSMYIKRRKCYRKRCGVTALRILRDKSRKKIPESDYDYIVENNSSKVAFFDEIERIYDEVCNKPNRKEL